MLDNLYDNIGGKIKNWAKWMFILEAFSAFIGGIILMAEEEFLYGLLCLIIGPIIAFVSTWLLYAFGEITEDIGLLRQKYVGDKVIEQQITEKQPTYQKQKPPTTKDLKAAKIRNMWADWSEEYSSIGQYCCSDYTRCNNSIEDSNTVEEFVRFAMVKKKGKN